MQRTVPTGQVHAAGSGARCYPRGAMRTRAALLRRPPAGVRRGARRAVRLLLLLAVLLPIVGCGAAGTSPGTAAVARADVVTCPHDADHHAVCEQATRPLAVSGPVRLVPDHGPLPPLACPLAPSTAPPAPCAVAQAPAGTGPVAPPGGALLVSIGVARH